MLQSGNSGRNQKLKNKNKYKVRKWILQSELKEEKRAPVTLFQTAKKNTPILTNEIGWIM